MFDTSLRRLKDIAIQPLVVLAGRIGLTALPVTFAGCILGLAAAVCAGFGLWPAALVLWLLNRVFDGLDGALARQQNVSSDLGAYLDIMADFLVYAALPLGIAVGQAAASQAILDSSLMLWPLTAFLLASFYVNAASWMFIAAIIEKRGASGEKTTSLVMPRGLIEGAETIFFFTLVLLVPTWAYGLFALFGVLVSISAIHRVIAWIRIEKHLKQKNSG
ncbi:CDP-alcohol phosphatidyltransferase family protein [Spirochaeta dissipatitropha]